MHTVGIRQLKSQLSEYVRRARNGEEILITSHGEVVAELRAPEPGRDLDAPTALRELSQSGELRRLVRNDSSRYRPFEEALRTTSVEDLLDWDRQGERSSR